MQYRLTRRLATTSATLLIEMESHDIAWRFAQQLLQQNSDAYQATYTEFANNKLVVRVMSKERILAKIESV